MDKKKKVSKVTKVTKPTWGSTKKLFPKGTYKDTSGKDREVLSFDNKEKKVVWKRPKTERKFKTGFVTWNKSITTKP